MANGKMALANLKAYKNAKELGDSASAERILVEFNKYRDDMGYGYLNKPSDIVPPVPTTFYSFHIMVILGTLFPVIFLLFLFFAKKGTLQSQRWLLNLGLACLPLGYIASEAGWVVAEVGRQPWAIQGLMPVSVANTNLTTGTVQTSFFMFFALFTLLLIAEIKIMMTQIKNGPEEN